MCGTCGCDHHEKTTITTFNTTKQHHHFHEHGIPHSHDHEKIVTIKENVTHHNDVLAQKNRDYFESNHIMALNFVSSPGAGKTTLLVQTISHLKNKFSFSVIEGDQQTLNDAERIKATGVPVVQVNTGDGCHLDSDMISHAINTLEISRFSILAIENVGNLVCPALFDLGERKRVVIVSVTEGEDKPLKYPNMFASADVCVISKVDLLPHLTFDFETLIENIRKVNPKITIIEYSTPQNEEKWNTWLENEFLRYINHSHNKDS